MQKSYTSLGLMSGTSGDGVDASLIQSNGMSYYESIQDKYYEYDESIYKKIHLLKEKINSKNDIITPVIKYIPIINSIPFQCTSFLSDSIAKSSFIYGNIISLLININGINVIIKPINNPIKRNSLNTYFFN